MKRKAIPKVNKRVMVHMEDGTDQLGCIVATWSSDGGKSEGFQVAFNDRRTGFFGTLRFRNEDLGKRIKML